MLSSMSPLNIEHDKVPSLQEFVGISILEKI